MPFLGISSVRSPVTLAYAKRSFAKLNVKKPQLFSPDGTRYELDAVKKVYFYHPLRARERQDKFLMF